MAKRFSNKLMQSIASLIEENVYTVTTICKIVGIGRKTFYEWKATRPQFAQAIDEAEKRRFESLRDEARLALHQKLKGGVQTVRRTVYVPSKDNPGQLEIKQHVVTEKQSSPDAKLLLHLLGTEKVVDNKEKVPLRMIVENDQTAVHLEELQVKVQAVGENLRHTIDNRTQLADQNIPLLVKTADEIPRVVHAVSCQTG